jgi:hypothetical protein
LGGGMMKRQMPQQPKINYIDVKSVDEYSSKVEKIGGKVVVPKKAVPGMGTSQFASTKKTTLSLASDESASSVSASFSCEMCNKKFNAREELKQHTIEKHRGNR